VTIPFSGCLPAALFCLREAKNHFQNRVVNIAGGAYVSTELIFINEPKFFKYADYLSFDRGYGSLSAILARSSYEEIPLYKTIYLSENNFIIKDASIGGNDTESINSDGARIDDEMVSKIYPDYSGVDFSRYIRPVDNENPMHRLWSDGHWIKAYTAYGCYWQKCSFCDTGLDYVRCYKPVNINSLFAHLQKQAEKTGIRAVHLVDEACPPSSLVRLALCNIKAGLPLVFWGNIRLEKSFTQDIAAILAAGGFLGFSAGLEVATEKGLARLNKGFDLQGAVDTIAALKEAGLLIHAYLIYGYWDQSEEEIVDSAEIVRQLFAWGLLDSAFWHQFSLTIHSSIYKEKKQGLHKNLKPTGDIIGPHVFALNDIGFEGENKFNKYKEPLQALTRQWMDLNTDKPVRIGPLKPSALVPHDFIAKKINSYAERKNSVDTILTSCMQVIFLANPVIKLKRLKKQSTEIFWRWRFKDCRIILNVSFDHKTLKALFAKAALGMSAQLFFEELKKIIPENNLQTWKKLRKNGLALYKS
jgi:hypothetical protein